MNILANKRNFIFIGILLVSFISWIISIFVGKTDGWAYNVFFSRTTDFLADFLHNIDYVKDRNPYFDISNASTEHIYPPLAYAIFYLFSRIVIFPTSYPDIIYQAQFSIIFILSIVFVILLFAIFLTTIGRNNRTKVSNVNNMEFILCVSFIFSYPVIFVIERGNLLLLSVTFLAGFFAFYNSKSRLLRELSLIFLALAFALKLSPAVFGLILLSDKRVKDGIRCAIYGILLFVSPFFLFHGGFFINLKKMAENIHSWNEIYKYLSGLGFFNTINVFVKIKLWTSTAPIVLTISRIIAVAMCILFVINIFLEKKQWKKVFMLTLITILLPYHVNPYNIIYFIPATLIFLLTADRTIFNLILMLVQSFLYNIFLYSFSDCYYNLVIPFLAIYFTIESIININRCCSRAAGVNKNCIH